MGKHTSSYQLRMAEELRQNPDLLRSRQGVLVILIVWLAFRTVFTGFDALNVLLHRGAPSSCVLNLVSLLICFAFAYCMYRGGKWFALMPLFGGLLTLYQVLAGQLLPLSLAYGDPLLVIGAVFTLLCGALQFILMLLLLVLPSLRSYLHAASRIHKATSERAKREL